MPPEAEQIDYDNATEEQLAALRGDEVTSDDEGATTTDSETAGVQETAGEETSAKGQEGDDAQGDTGDQGDGGEGGETTPAPTNTGFMIPKSRYDAVMARLKETEAKLQEQTQPPTTVQQMPQQQTAEPDLDVQLSDIDNQIADAVREGDGDKVAQLMSQSRQLQNEAISEQFSTVQNNAVSASAQQIHYDAFVQQVERFIPETRPESENYDEGLVLEISELADAYEMKGVAPAEALQKALGYIRPGWNQPQDAETTQTETKPEPRTTDVKTNVETAKTQPPSMEAGDNSDTAGIKGKIDPMKISDSDFDKLTEEQLAEMRGDNF